MRTLTLGLALGAGGTKGAAHVGVMQVLDEAGLKADVVSGTSIGALYGGCYAVGRSPQEMADGIRTCPRFEVISFFRHRLKLRDSNRLARKFYGALTGFYIEDLPVRFAATASDIVDRKHVAITSGPIIDAIEASIAIPVIARPVAHQGRYYLDGGFWDRAPVDAAHALGADVIVSVELGRPYQLPASLRRPAARIASGLDRFALQKTIAGVPFTIRAVSSDLIAGRTAHVVIRPPLPRFGGTSPFHMTRSLEAGIAAAKDALPAIRALLAGEPVVEVAEEFAPNQRMMPDTGLLA
jgi:NTE family protein